MKICSNTKCSIKDPQSLDNFCKDKSRKDGLYPYCRKCRVILNNKRFKTNEERIDYFKNYRKEYKSKYPERLKNQDLKKTFNITLEEYNNILITQCNKCAICNKDQSEFKKALYVDHDHLTGKIRGLLCGYCNSGLGYFKDNINNLLEAIKYLKA